MPTLAELQDALVNADKAGDAAAAQKLADAIVEMKKSQDAKPTSVRAGETLMGIPRQLGLTARYGMEGVGQAAELVTEPVRRLVTDPIARLLGSSAQSQPLSALAGRAADAIGLPKPEGSNERVVGDAARLMAGAGGLSGAGRLAQGASGTVGEVAKFLASNPAQQLTSAAGAGLAGGSVREAGGSPLAQAGAALIGGVATPTALNAIEGVGRTAINAGRRTLDSLAPGTVTNQNVDQKITLVLRQAGVDWNDIAANVKASVRKDVADALNTGRELDAAALRRLVDFRTVGATPTRGMLTLDPVQITREKNLSKIGANSMDPGLQSLANLENANNTTFIRNLNDAGATKGDLFGAGSANINRISATDEALKRNVSGLYQAARDMPGGNIPLDRTKLVNGVFEALNRENKLAYLPGDIADTLNSISQGVIQRNGQQFQVPFDAKALDNLLTDIATAQRSTQDGNVKAALKIAREAINQMPVTPVKTQFGGNQLVTELGAKYLRDQDAQAGNFMGALNQARKAAAQRFGWQESAKPIEAALGGAAPDNFVKRFVIGGTLQDAEAVARNGNVDATKNAIVAHLKERALGGSADEVGKFSQAAYNKALKELGDRKLSLFFSEQEIAQLKALGRAASYAQVQPTGSAVNNSNSGALVAGKALDALQMIAGKLPLGVDTTINGLLSGVQQRQAANIPRALLAAPEEIPLELRLGMPALYGGLLATQPANQR